MKKWILGVAALSIAGIAPRAHAWEPTTTQAGLAEQAALSSRLHKRLVSLGFTGGLFEPLTVPPADAPTLIEALKLLPPSNGMVPDARGRQTALAWIAAGSALADVPGAYGANHFFDPATGKGWIKPERAVLARLGDKIRQAIGRDAIPDTGMPAPDWITAKDNPFNLAGFLAQYSKAITSATPGERARAMAGALVAAGAIIHVLGDVGAPSRVRGDSLAHFEPLGGGPDDLGSRTERIAALVYGRLGVPAPAKVITRAHIRDYFTSKDGGGLADITAKAYFSTNTLPGASRINEEQPALARPLPALPARLNLMAASHSAEGTTLRDASQTCLARYKVEHGVLSWWLDDDCILEQLAVILPNVAAYETGLLDFLTRGDLVVAIDGNIVGVGAKDLGPGQLDLFAEDDRGVRTRIATSAVTGAKAEGDVIGRAELTPAATAATKLVAVFRGADSVGEPIVATGIVVPKHE